MGCTKSKMQNVYEEPSPSSSLDNDTQELLRTYANLQRRRMSYPIYHNFYPPTRQRRPRFNSE